MNAEGMSKYTRQFFFYKFELKKISNNSFMTNGRNKRASHLYIYLSRQMANQ